MAGMLHLQLVTPERQVLETEAEIVELPGAEGYLGVLPGHTPLVVLLKTGVLSYRGAGGGQALAISPGLAEISNDRVLVLADSAEAAAQIDAAAAERDRESAAREMATASAETLPALTARFELAQARLAVARKG